MNGTVNRALTLSSLLERWPKTSQKESLLLWTFAFMHLSILLALGRQMLNLYLQSLQGSSPKIACYATIRLALQNATLKYLIAELMGSAHLKVYTLIAYNVPRLCLSLGRNFALCLRSGGEARYAKRGQKV